jgi:hypothetical protein
MHQQNPTQPSDLPSPDQVDRAILDLLLLDPGVGPWTIPDLVREIGNPTCVDDSVRRLYRANLIHRLGEDFAFVWASRATVHLAALLDAE